MEAQDVNTSSANQIKYIRPSDRSPEKDFHARDEESKINACLLRSSVSKARQKIETLRDEVEEREKEVETERQLRQAAEARLEAHLQDMYQNPEVNQELRERLPRANKTDPLKSGKEGGDISESSKSDPFKKEREAQDTEESSIEEHIIVEVDEKTMSASKMKQPEMRVLEAQIIRDKGSLKSSSPKSSRKHDHQTGARPKTKEQSSAETQTQPFSLERSHTFPFTNIPPSHGYFGHAFGATPFMPYPGSHFLPSAPLLNSTSLFQENPSFRPTSAPVLNSSINTNRLEVPHISTSLSSPLHASVNLPGDSKESSPLKSEPQKMIGGNTSARSGRSLDSGLGSHLSIASPRTTLLPQQGASMGATSNAAGTSLLPDPFMVPMSPRIPVDMGYGAEHNRQIASLLNELDAQRADYKKIKEKFAEQEKELEALKITLKAKDLEIKSDATETAIAVGIVEEVYEAQRKRDEATLGRMKVVNEEKEDVIERCRNLEKRLDEQSSPNYLNTSNEEIITDAEDMDQENLNLILSQLDSPSASDMESNSMVRRMELMRQRQKEMINEEMQVIIEQRDAALARCRKLEAELLHYQKQEDGGSTANSNLKAKLAAVEKERDLALAKSRQLDDEIQKIRLYYSLYKSLSQEESVQQQTNNTLVTYENQLKQSNQEVEVAQKENNRLVAQLRTATIEKKQLAEALEIAKTDKEKLQRLATVLRKKLNAMNNTPRNEDQKDYKSQ